MPTIADQQSATLTFDRLHKLRAFQRETVSELDAIAPAVMDKAFRGL